MKKKLNRIAFILLINCVSGAVAAQSIPPLSPPSDIVLANFQVTGVPVTEALLKAAREAGVPIGIIQDNDAISKEQVTFSAQGATLGVILDSLLKQVNGYSWTFSSADSVVLITPTTERQATQRFLAMIIDRYAPPKINQQGLATWLWIYIQAIFHPDRGTAGSILGTVNEPTWELKVNETSVQGILNRIAYVTKGAWVLKPLPEDLTSLTTPPYTLFSY